ncbi:hypothetical protein JIG36_05240 [Actinoplanes sp. LDG1-06]|uniref:Uncharacterized protein n=1 Tax=Paractinoplanes ovalisporus TaxID=2810368 RepID=A0ABS2A6N6_9ACTN|nr:hypothetical protein [Actinoplanes ovalisporus]MBM2614963.1 hypothetical protein [Actinoplanes ovalisporus]
MEIVEQFVLGKTGDPQACEDAIVVTAAHAAVIDGATDLSGRTYAGRPGGWWAMAACRDAVLQLPPDADAHAAVEAMTSVLQARTGPGLTAAERPSAAVTVYSRARREIWQVGDVGFAYRGLPATVGQPRKLVDQIAASFRAAVVAAEVAAGTLTLDSAPEIDPGRLGARALISRQGALRNRIGPYGYAAIDGRPVPRPLVKVHPIPEDINELTLASDGYPLIGETLAASEAELAALLEKDPWCVAELAGTKGVGPGQLSFDDRAYLRIRI